MATVCITGANRGIGLELARQLAGAARTLLGAWRNRTKETSHMFGHGQRFVAGKWPPT